MLVPHCPSARSLLHLLSFAAALLGATVAGAPPARAVETWQRMLVPAARSGHTAILDLANSRIVVYGGGQVWALSTTSAGRWTQLVPTGNGPGTRNGYTAIYDAPRQRMILFGGQWGSTRYADVWSLSLSGTPAWTQLAPSGTAPSGRSGHSAIYDAPRQRMIVFGGNDRSVANDTWELALSGTPTWTKISAVLPTPPAPRELHTAVYDAELQSMIVFGGRGVAGTPFGDTWVLSLSSTPAWRNLTGLVEPAARYGHSAVMDPDGSRMVVYGGTDASGVRLADVVALNITPSGWSTLAPSGTAPESRTRHSAVALASPERMLVFGGSGASGTLGDLWSLSLGSAPSWSQLTSVADTPFPGRTGQAFIYDPVRQRMIIFGGQDGSTGWLNDVWALSLTEPQVWTALAPTGTPPSGRVFSRAYYDPVRDRMMIVGGFSSSTPIQGECWTLSLGTTPAWERYSDCPGGVLAYHSAIYDPVRDRLIVFNQGTVRALALATGVWTRLFPTGPSSGTEGQSAIYDPEHDQLLIFGGDIGGTFMNTTFGMSLDAHPAMAQIVPAGTLPIAREAHSAVLDPRRDRMLVFGGLGYGWVARDDLWALSFTNGYTWAPIAPAPPAPGIRQGHSAIYDPAADRMIVFGGDAQVDGYTHVYLDDLWALSMSSVAEVRPGPGPTRLALAPVRPTPSLGAARLDLELPAETLVRIRIHDVAGRVVRTLVERRFTAGRHAVSWDGRDAEGVAVAPGVYLCEARAGSSIATTRIVLLR